MRIAMVSEHASPLAALGGVDAGGQNVHVAALAEHLARRGHEVVVYTRRDAPEAEQPERQQLTPGATVVHVPVGPGAQVPKDDLYPLMDAFGQWMAQDWRRHGRPDVVHAHFWMSGLAALQAARGAGVPMVQTFHALGSVKRRHQGSADTSPPGRIDIERGLVAGANLVIATCSDEVEELRRLGACLEHVEVIPCGVDTGHFRPDDAAAREREPGAAPMLLTVGRLVERKGFDVAIRALAQLPGATLVIAGGTDAALLAEDPEARRLRALARDLGVGDRVHLVGAVPHQQMPALYRSADVVLSTPWYEPFGITPVEAAACGRPLVGSAVGGLLDTVVEGVTGHLVPPRDPDALAATLAGLLADPGRRARMGDAGRRRAAQRYEWSEVAARTEQALTTLVARSGVARSGVARREVATAPDAGSRAWLRLHAAQLEDGMAGVIRHASTIDSWGQQLAVVLAGGGRVLAAGNGGSAAEAEHFTGELVGRFLDDRRPLSAVSLCSDTASLTAILNDYGAEEVFARQVAAHGRRGDVLLLMSTSGRSPNVLAAARRAKQLGLRVWGLTGPAPNPLAALSDEALAVPAGSTAAVQEMHLVVVHAVCAALDVALARIDGAALDELESAVADEQGAVLA